MYKERIIFKSCIFTHLRLLAQNQQHFELSSYKVAALP